MALLCLFASAAALLSVLASAQTEPPVSAHIDRLDIVDVSSDRVRFSVAITAIPKQKATISTISFHNVTVDSVPVYLQPVDGPIAGEPGKNIQLKPILATVYFRDLTDGPRPVEAMVSAGRARVSGQAVIHLSLGALPSLLWLTRRAQSELKFSQEIPIQPPGGAIGRAGTLLLLKAAAGAMDLLKAGRDLAPFQTRSEFLPLLVYAESRYSMEHKTLGSLDFLASGIGLRISKEQVVLSAEIAEPWAFQTDAVAARQIAGFKLRKPAPAVQMWLGASATPFAGEFRLLRQAPRRQFDTVVHTADGKVHRLKVARRASEGNLSLWQFANPPDLAVAVNLAEPSSAPEQYLLFRFSRPGSVESVYLPAQPKNGLLELADPIDRSAAGSPLIARGAVLALLQSDRVALPVSKVRSALKLR